MLARHRSSLWWGIWLFASLAMLLFIAFDLLDLDGSNLGIGRPGANVAAETAPGEADRLLAAALPAPALDAVGAFAGPAAALSSPVPRPTALPAPPRPRRASFRSHAQGSETSGGPAPADPV